ncbi:MAG: serine protease, partial [Cyanobacteria bacterium J06639_18]
MKIDRILSYSIIGASVALAQSQFVVAQFSSPVNQIAKKITVQIEGKNSNSTGSGVIITKKANTYTILTAAHFIVPRFVYDMSC